MKFKSAKVIILSMIISVTLPLHVMAYGGYYAVKGEKIYHSVSCIEVMGYELEDLKYYETESKAIKAKLKSANCCSGDGYDFESDGATVWYSSDTKIQNALEMERMFGVFDGYDAGIEEGRLEGFEAGRDAGFEAGYDNGYADAKKELEEKQKKENKTSSILLVIIIAIFGLPILNMVFETIRSIVDTFKRKN